MLYDEGLSQENDRPAVLNTVCNAVALKIDINITIYPSIANIHPQASLSS
jgi:hypothetical protein